MTKSSVKKEELQHVLPDSSIRSASAASPSPPASPRSYHASNNLSLKPTNRDTNSSVMRHEKALNKEALQHASPSASSLSIQSHTTITAASSFSSASTGTRPSPGRNFSQQSRNSSRASSKMSIQKDVLQHVLPDSSRSIHHHVSSSSVRSNSTLSASASPQQQPSIKSRDSIALQKEAL